jgi:hypothetical protein
VALSREPQAGPDPARPLPGIPDRDPFEELTEEERARAKRTLLHRVLLGGIVFLTVVVLGLLPSALGDTSPALGRAASIAAWVVAPLLGAGLLVFALVRLRR